MKSLLWKAGIGLLSLTINGYAAGINCTVGKLGNKWCEPLENGDYASYIDFGENRGTVLGHLAKDIGGDHGDPVYAVAIFNNDPLFVGNALKCSAPIDACL